MEATCSSETSANFQLIAERYIPEDRTLHNYRCENFKSYNFRLCKVWFGVRITPLRIHIFQPAELRHKTLGWAGLG
jgi:hypothetical protein